MDGCLNPIDSTGYKDRQHVNISFFEFDGNMHIGWLEQLKMSLTSALSPKFTTMYTEMKNKVFPSQFPNDNYAIMFF